MTTSNTPKFWLRTAMIGAAVALMLSGCAAEEGAAPETPEASTEPADAPAEEVQEEAPADSGLTAEHIAATITPHGFECEVKEARLDSRDELVECRAADYVIISATSLVDESTMSDQVANAKDTICKNQDTLGMDAFHSATSGKWVFTPGGDDDKNLAAFDQVMPEFGLERTVDSC